MRKETLVVRILYNTLIGRGILKILVQPSISKLGGIFLDTYCSKWIIPFFVKKHQIDMKAYQGMKFSSFNDFFTRKRQTDKIDCNVKQLISPCDGYLSVYSVNEQQTYSIKNVEYRLEELLQDKELAKRYSGGLCLIFRLTPQDYHRYCYVCDGIKKDSKAISGKLHCVRPIAYTSRPVFIENSREYTVIQSKEFGQVIQMEIGALLVGKIHNHDDDKNVSQGREKGYFEFGGSTIVVLVEKDRLYIQNEFIRKTYLGEETKVRLGEVVGELI